MTGGGFADLAVGPNGQVAVAYENPLTARLRQLFSSTWTRTGSAPAASARLLRPPRPMSAGSAASPHRPSAASTPPWGWRSTAAAVRTPAGSTWCTCDERPSGSGDTDIELGSSDNAGAIWSAPIRVNDDNTTLAQFLPRIALDQITGAVGITWYDCRQDTGTGAGDTDGVPNTDAEVWGAVVTDVAEVTSRRRRRTWVTQPSATQIQLTWQDDSTNESGFRSSAPRTSRTGPRSAPSGPVYHVPRCHRECGSTYHYRVLVFNTAGNSAFSNVASNQTGAGPGRRRPRT